MTVRKPIGIALLFMLGLMSCMNSPDQISNDLSDGWAYDEVITFTVNDPSTGGDGPSLVLDHSPEYNYQNLYLIITVHSNAIAVSDTLDITLSDNKGLWRGDCRSAHCLIVFDATTNQVSPSGSYELSIEQYSRDPILKGINSIGIHY